MSTPPPSAARPNLRLIGAAVIIVAIGVGAVAFYLPGLRTTMADAQTKATAVEINGDRAYGYLKEVCKLGPHPAGSAANGKVRALAREHFVKQGGKVREQAFSGVDPISKAPVAMVNLIGSWFPERQERIVLAAHYDSRPFPDEDPDPAKRKQPFLGANDPGSGIALLMEIAHHLEDPKATPWGVDLVLFDGEELVYGSGQDQVGEYFFGSKAFAREYSERKRASPRYAAGILFDMVGGKDLVIEKEQYSLEFAPKLVSDVWAVARSLKVAEFRDRTGPAVYDDHLALNNGGIPTIDLIQFPYKYWHTANDLPENCSADSLAQVGKVVVTWLGKPKPKAR